MRMHRRLMAGSLTVTVLALSLLAGGPRQVHAQIAADCTISGAGTISPGLGLIPAAQVYSFNGEQQPCAGVNVLAGPISGFMTCPMDTVQVCAPDGSFQLSGSPQGSCSGTFSHQGTSYSFTCTGVGPMVITGSFTLTPNGTSLPIVSYTFTGDMSISRP